MTSTSRIEPMTRDESYAQRRELFKNIWKTSLKINPNDPNDILNRPKIIKTLRMDEIDKCPVGKSKKERIKNLRHVCNRILDFCDKQDADDLHYQQVSHDESPDKTQDFSVKSYKTKKPNVQNQKKIKNLFRPRAEVTVARYSADGKIKTTKHVKTQNEYRIVTGNKRMPIIMTTRVPQPCLKTPPKVFQSIKTKKMDRATAGPSSPLTRRTMMKKVKKHLKKKQILTNKVA